MPNFGEWLFGSPDKLKKVATGTPEQQALHGNVISQAMGLSQGGYKNAQDYYGNFFQPGNQAYENFAAPFMNQFEEQILPMIAERFAGGGALSSSGFGQALGGAGAGLQANLAQLFAQLQAQAAGSLTNQYNQLSQTGLNYQPFAYQKQQGSGGLVAPLLTGVAGAMGGPLGAMAGQGISSGISSLFKKPNQGGNALQGAQGMFGGLS